ncbi:MAG: gliding motility-associated C-terminal domain-containing protein [Saprospiraceae bacterium]|nr:gliding motility-associated C-terminal domain-containing protein [Saprospiraceae bacterium]
MDQLKLVAGVFCLVDEVFDQEGYLVASLGINDVFRLYGNNGIKKVLRLTIFDRHGNMVFQQLQDALGDSSPGWDGTHKGRPVDTSTCFLVAEIEMMDGTILFHQGQINLVK